MSQLQKNITDFRHAYHLVGGCVIVWGDAIQAWQDDLKDPHVWIPGVVAYFEDGRRFRAVGGNNQDGATEWERLTTA